MKKSFSKKSLALLLAVAVVLTSLVTAFAVTASATVNPTNVWGGQSDVATSYAEGSGTGETANDPILISNGAELARLIKDKSTANKYYKLTADIYLNDVTKENWKETANSWFSNPERGEARFSGNLDGDGHTIYGLYYKGSQSSMGLFILTDDYYGRVSYSNLRIAESYIETTGTYAGVIAGWEYDNGGANGGYEFNKCIIEDTVTVIAGEYAGGLVGYANAETTINACACYGSVDANYKGGLAGQKANSSSLNITQSFVVNHWLVGSGTPTYSAIYSMVPANEIIGEAAKTRMPDLAWDEVWYTTENGYPTLTAPETPSCTHENTTTTEKVTKEATYFTTGLKDVICECGETIDTGVEVPATDVVLESCEEKFENSNLIITLTYSEGLLTDIDNGAEIYFNYSIGGYNPAPIKIDTSELAASTVVTLEGFNIDRINAQLTYYLTADYGEVNTAKLETATKRSFKVADKVEANSEISTLINALNAENANTVVSTEIGASQSGDFDKNTITADVKAGTMVLNFIASNDLVAKLAENQGLTRTNKITVTIDGVENVYTFTPEVMKKSTTVKISGMSFAQLYGKVTITVAFEYAEDASKNITDTIEFVGAAAVAATNSDVATAFKNYIA
ncbi:MAG: hypothetical protein IJD00_00870 [Clostridia bacterium]|nr:hypothetical protein [Clostridia bacterium]